jgi:hypothetical protein
MDKSLNKVSRDFKDVRDMCLDIRDFVEKILGHIIGAPKAKRGLKNEGS